MLRDAKLVSIVGFIGKKGSGKTTCSELLQQLGRDNNVKVIRVAFADPLKRICSDLYCFAYDIPVEAFYGTQEEKEQVHPALGNRSGREVLQFLGTGCFKAITPDIWITYTLRHIDIAIKYGADIVVIDDVRFPEEAQALKERGAILIRVERLRDVTYSQTETHESETAMDTIDVDETIWNNSDKFALSHQLQRFL